MNPSAETARRFRSAFYVLVILSVTLLALFNIANKAGAVIERTYTFPFATSYSITCPWGPYSNCGLSGWHYGTDYSLGGNTTPGESVVAARSGTAWHHEDFDPITGLGCGYYLVIAHGDGHRTRYCHLNDRTVGNGAAVSRGQVIGHEGSSGASGVHLHFDTRHGGTNGSDCCSGTSVDPYAGPYSPSTYLWSTSPPSYYRGTETVGVFRDWITEWRLNDQHNDSTTDHLVYYGQDDDRAVYGDWNADGKGSIGVFRNNPPYGARWFLDDQLDGYQSEHQFNFGQYSYTPVAGNWSSSGSRPGYYRAQGGDGWWYINYGFDGLYDHSFRYGLANDLPVTGDWDCDGDETVGVFRYGSWYLNNELDETSSYPPISYGQAGDIPVAGDWDGDGCDTIGVFRYGTWYLNDDLDGASEYIYSYGISIDQPGVGDWNGQ